MFKLTIGVMLSSSLVESDPHSVQSMQRVWGHGHTKFVLEECESGECPTSFIPEIFRKLAMIAKPSIKRVADTYRNLWLRRSIPGNLLMVIDQYVRQNKFCMVMSPDPFPA